MSGVGLIVLGECGEAITEIKSESSENNWVMFGYSGRTNELKVEEKGSGGLEEFTENLNDGRIEFGYLRFAINQTFKFLFVSWCGGGVDGMRKGLFNNHTKEMENWLGQGGRGFHLQINARTEDDLDPKLVLDKLNKVSAFIRASSLKSAAQDKEKAKEQSSQYWQKEKQIDAQRKEALTAHQQNQQKNLQVVKEQEQRRLEQEAKQTMSSMEAQRQANVQEYQAREQERTQTQSQMQEQRRAQVLGDVQQRKAASYVPADYSHDVKAQQPAPGPRAAYNSAPAPAAPAPVAKKAPGRIAQPSAFTQPPPAAAPKPGPTKPFKPAPPPVSSAPKPSKPAPPPAPKPTYHEPEPEPAYEEPAYQEPEPAYQEQSYEDQSYQDQSYQEQAYEEPAQTYEEPAQEYQEPAQEEYQEQYQEQAYEEPAAEQAYDDGSYQQVQAKALYDYNAEAETDLSFAEGDIINILEDQDPSGWWKGELNGAEGFFPSNFVERI